MVAWDSTQWGNSLDDVPAEYLGRTPIISHFFTFPFQTAFAPQFGQGAILPIPEPSTWALMVLGAGVLWCTTRARRRKSFPPPSRTPE
jgi:hypothetical protein